MLDSRPRTLQLHSTRDVHSAAKQKRNLSSTLSGSYFPSVIDNHLESNLDCFFAGSGPAYVAKMQDSMPGAVCCCGCNVDQAHFLVTLSRPGEPGDSNRKVCQAPIQS